MSQVTRWYPSKVDWWLAAVLAIGPVVSIGAGVAAIAAGASALVALIGPLVMVAVYAGLVFPMRYGMTEETLIVRHGLVRQKIRLADITEVYPTRNPLSSPALSLDRLHLTFGRGYFKSAMISPADKGAFLDELAGKAPRAQIRR